MNRYWASVICAFLICLSAIIVLFNPYHYSMYEGKYPVRDNWITGKTEIMKGNPNIKWNEID